LTACLRDLARHFKTDPTEIVAFCFGIPERLDEEGISGLEGEDPIRGLTTYGGHFDQVYHSTEILYTALNRQYRVVSS
jgi:hypothetical protein